jgi:hypothetical protein
MKSCQSSARASLDSGALSIALRKVIAAPPARTISKDSALSCSNDPRQCQNGGRK